MPWGPAPTVNLVIPSDAGPGTARIEIGADVPPTLVAFYAAALGGPYIVMGGTFSYSALGDYEYTAYLNSSVSVAGAYDHITNRVAETYQFFFNAPTDSIFAFGVNSTGAVSIPLGFDLRIDGKSGPRGWLNGQSCAPVGSVTMATSGVVGTEVAVPALTWTGVGQPVFTFQPGRLYRVPMTCNLFASAAGNRARVNLRKIGGGALLISKYATLVLGAGAVESHDWTCYLGNFTAAPIATQIDMTVTMVAGAGNVNLFAEVTATSIAPTEFGIEDIGSIASNPGLANAARGV